MRFHTAVLIGMTAMAFTTSSRGDTIAYVLDNVWLLPDISHPSAGARPLTGTFEWTFESGDFENGTGEFIALDVPWWSEGFPPLAWTIEQSQIEIVMDGNYHDLGVDVTLRCIEPLAPGGSSTIDTVFSQFEIQVGVSWQGHVISGRIVPQTTVCPADIDGDGSVAFSDLVPLLAAWGPCIDCAQDLDADGEVGFDDLVIMLSAWGPCS